MTLYSIPDLLAAVNRFVHDNLPGCTPVSLSISLQDQDKVRRFRLPVSILSISSLQEPEAQNEKRNRDSSLPDCITDILLTLREHHPRPLTKTRLLEEMFKAGRTYADSTVARYLAVLMEDGTIDNPGPKAKPPGYRLNDATNTTSADS